MAVGEADATGAVGPEGIEEDGALFLDVFSGCVGRVSHVAENLLGAGTSEKRDATTKVAGEAEGAELVGKLVALPERLVNMEDFRVRETEVELAEMLAAIVDEVVGVREDVAVGNGVSLGEHGVGRGLVAEMIAAGEVVDEEDDERREDCQA